MSQESMEKTSPLAELGRLLKNNIQQYAMYIVLVVIIGIFTATTHGGFLRQGNIVNLINQVGYVAVLAIGMTLILIIRHIDLSVGYVAGFVGAVVAIMLKNGYNVWLTLLVGLLVGACIGLYQGTLVAYVGVPAFVTTLAGMFIFRGTLLVTLQKTGTIITSDPIFNAMSNGYIPDIVPNSPVNLLTVLIGLIAVAFVVITQLRKRAQRKRYGFKLSSPAMLWAGILLSTALILVLVWILATYNGIPVTAAIVLGVLLLYNFILNQTKLGRHIYGIGGNTEASALCGINVKRVTLFCFISMSTLAALAGMLYTSRLTSATPAAGVGFEMEAIASCYIGGVAVSGGKGRVTNTLVGAFIMASLTNGMNLMYMDAAFQYIIKGVIFIAAVAFDVVSRQRAK